jgi:tetratricopeptide (TPR) repeat protein
MPTKIRFRLVLALLGLLFAGCTSVRTLTAPFEYKGDFSELARHYRQLAEQSLFKEEWYQTREFLKVAATLEPDNTEADDSTKIAALSEKIETQSDRFYHIGITEFENGNYEKARQAFVEALRINPEHEGAVLYVVDKLQDPETSQFEVEQKTGLKEIAEKIYGDPSKSGLIAYYNDMEESELPTIGRKLAIPPVPPKPPPPVEAP